MREGWREVRLGEVCDISIGRTPARKDGSLWDATKEGDNVWLSIADLPRGRPPVVSDSEEYISDRGAQGGKMVLEGTLLVSFKLTLGRLAIAGRDLYTNEAIAALSIRDEEILDRQYLYWYLSFFDWQGAAEGEDKVKGKTLNKAKLQVLSVLLPPLPEQKRIVAILDEAFAGIDRAIANTEKNLANARELFESYLNAVFSRKGEGWVEKDINGLSEIAYGYTAPASSAPVGPKFLRITDIRDNSVDWESVPYCTISEDDHAKHQLLDGDIVFARTGATTGKSYLLVSPPDAVCASYLIRLRVLSEIVRPAFMRYFFRTSAYWNVIASGTAGSAQGGFNATKLSGLVVPFPESLVEQDRIVLETQQLSELASGIENQCLTKLSALSTLKQSLLQKAFSGELTAKEADRVMAGA